jgi:hypothetical protein
MTLTAFGPLQRPAFSEPQHEDAYMPQLKSVRREANVSPGALKLKEARQYLGGLSVPTMHRLIQRGLLRPNKSTRHLLFTISELDRFLRDGMT